MIFAAHLLENVILVLSGEGHLHTIFKPHRGEFAAFPKQNDKYPGMGTLGIDWAISNRYPLIKSSAINVVNIKDLNTTLVLEHLSRRYLHNAYKQPEMYNKYLKRRGITTEYRPGNLKQLGFLYNKALLYMKEGDPR